MSERKNSQFSSLGSCLSKQYDLDERLLCYAAAVIHVTEELIRIFGAAIRITRKNMAGEVRPEYGQDPDHVDESDHYETCKLQNAD